jgi:hypothetical protein
MPSKRYQAYRAASRVQDQIYLVYDRYYGLLPETLTEMLVNMRFTSPTSSETEQDLLNRTEEGAQLLRAIEDHLGHQL